MSFPLNIITPSGEVFKGDVTSLVAPGTNGLFGVLENHAPLVASLAQGNLSVNQGSSEINFEIDSGILEVTDAKECFILTNQAQQINN